MSEESDHAHYLFLQSQPAILAVNTKKDETVVKPGKVNNAVIKCFNSIKLPFSSSSIFISVIYLLKLYTYYYYISVKKK